MKIPHLTRISPFLVMPLKQHMELPNLIHRVEQWRRRRPETEVISFVEQLFEFYLTAEPDDRRSLRQAVSTNRDLWNVAGDDDICVYLAHIANSGQNGAERHLRAWLIAVSLTGGCGDWRDTIVVLGELKQAAEATGASVRRHFEEIAATAEYGNVHGISGMSTRELILSAGRLTRNEAIQSERARDSEGALENRRPWWRFWK